MLPRSLTTQTTAIMIVGLVAAYLVGLFFYSRDRLEALMDLSLRNAAQTVAHINHMVAETPPAWRSQIVRSFDAPRIRTSLTERSAIPVEVGHHHRESAFLAHLKDQAHGAELNDLRVKLSEPESAGSGAAHSDTAGEALMHGLRALHGLPAHLTVRTAARMADGNWLNMEVLLPELPTVLWSPSLVTVALMTAAIVLVSIWVVRRMVQPLWEFAHAARRFARDVDAPPMTEDGPIEVREVVEAFNEMQTQIQKFIRNRTAMMASISHDIRTPVSRLRLRTEALPESEDRSRLLATLSDLEDVVNASLTFARQSVDLEERRKIDLTALLETICVDLSETGAAIEFSGGPPRTLVWGQPVALRRAFANLVENGTKYAGRVTVSLDTSATSTAVRIEDDGPGIPEEELDTVFDPFYRGDRARSGDVEGTGLGLSLARTVIEGHGGQIDLRNRPEGGLSAHVTLPLCD